MGAEAESNMIVAVAVVELHIHDSQSLKSKRGVVRSIAGRLRNRFNASVAEVGGQGTWQRATLGLSMAGSDERVLRRAIRRAVDFVEQTHLAEVLDSDVEILRLALGDAAGGRYDVASEDLPWDVDAEVDRG